LLLFVTFFTIGNLEQLLFIVEKGQGLYCIDRATRKGCTLIFFLIFFLQLRGKGWKLMLFFSLHWKCGRRRGEMGTFFPFLKNIFVLFRWMTGWMMRWTDGWKASFRPWRPLLYKNIRSPFLYLFLLSFYFAFLFFLFFRFSFIFFFK